MGLVLDQIGEEKDEEFLLPEKKYWIIGNYKIVNLHRAWNRGRGGVWVVQ